RGAVSPVGRERAVVDDASVDRRDLQAVGAVLREDRVDQGNRSAGGLHPAGGRARDRVGPEDAALRGQRASAAGVDAAALAAEADRIALKETREQERRAAGDAQTAALAPGEVAGEE